MSKRVNIKDRFFRPGSEEPDAIPEPYLGVGYELQRARADLGLDLARVARDLRIQSSFLEAIEDGRFEDLPGPTYAAGFLRSYADFLGIEREQVMELYRGEIGSAAVTPELRFPQPLEVSGRPTRFFLLLLVAIILAGYGIWHFGRTQALPKFDAVEVLPDRLKALLTTDPPAKAPATPAPEAVADPPALPSTDEAEAPAEPAAVSTNQDETSARLATKPAIEPVTEPEPPVMSEAVRDAIKETVAANDDGGREETAVATATTAPPSPPAETTPPPPPQATDAMVPAARPQVYGAGHLDSRIVVRALGNSWVQVTGAGNDLLLTRMLKAGDSYRVPNRPDLLLTTGNAGAIELIVDGRVLGRLGPLGAVRRDVVLVVEDLLGRYGDGAAGQADGRAN